MKNLVLLDIFEQPQKEQDYIQIDRFVTKLLAEKKLLLVFSGELDRIQLFKKVSFYGNSFAKPLRPYAHKGTTFIQHIFRHVEPHFKRLEWKAAERFSNAKKQGKLVTEPAQILEYASKGRVKLLFIAEDKMLWGYLDTRKKAVLTHERQRDAFDEDVLDDLSELVLKHRGAVFVLPQGEMPGNKLIFAILRDDYEKIIFEKKTLKTAG